MYKPKYHKGYSYNLLKYLYEAGVYSRYDLMEYVDMGNITKEQFHDITRYYYDGLEKKEEN